MLYEKNTYYLNCLKRSIFVLLLLLLCQSFLQRVNLRVYMILKKISVKILSMSPFLIFLLGTTIIETEVLRIVKHFVYQFVFRFEGWFHEINLVVFVIWLHCCNASELTHSTIFLLWQLLHKSIHWKFEVRDFSVCITDPDLSIASSLLLLNDSSSNMIRDRKLTDLQTNSPVRHKLG